MAINYYEGLKRIKRLVGAFWLGVTGFIIILLSVLLLMVYIVVTMINTGITPWTQVIMVLLGLVIIGILGYMATVRTSISVAWVVKGFLSKR